MCLWNLVLLVQTVGEIYSSEGAECGISTVLNFDNCQPEAASDIVSGMADQDVGMDVCANIGDFRLKLSQASFSALFRTSITSDRKYMVTSYPVCW